MRVGGDVRGSEDVRKTADDSGQIQSKSNYIGCQNCIIFAFKTCNFSRPERALTFAWDAISF